MKRRGIFGIILGIIMIIFGAMNMLLRGYWKDVFGGFEVGQILLSICFIYLGIHFIVEWRKNRNDELLTEEDSTNN